MKKMIIDEREIVTTRSGRLGPVKKMKIKLQNPPEALRQTVRSAVDTEDASWEDIKPRVTLLKVLEGLYSGIPLCETAGEVDSDTEDQIVGAIERATGLPYNFLYELAQACYRARF